MNINKHKRQKIFSSGRMYANKNFMYQKNSLVRLVIKSALFGPLLEVNCVINCKCREIPSVLVLECLVHTMNK